MLPTSNSSVRESSVAPGPKPPRSADHFPTTADETPRTSVGIRSYHGLLTWIKARTATPHYQSRMWQPATTAPFDRDLELAVIRVIGLLRQPLAIMLDVVRATNLPTFSSFQMRSR